jgi:tryptophan-rich sensory protein
VFIIIRWFVLTLLGYASYRVWISTKKNSRKYLIAFSVYFVTLFADWLTIFISPTKLDFAAGFYAFIVILAVLTAYLFRQFDALSILCTLPYILWLLFMTIFCHILHEMNHDDWWFFKEDLSVDIGSNTTMKSANQKFG